MEPSAVAAQAAALYQNYGDDDVYAAGILKCTLEAWLCTSEELRPLFSNDSFNQLQAAALNFQATIGDHETTLRLSRICRPTLLWVYSASITELPTIIRYSELIFDLIESQCPSATYHDIPRTSRLTLHQCYATALSQLLISAHHTHVTTAARYGTRTRFARRFSMLLRRYYAAHGRILTDSGATNTLLS